MFKWILEQPELFTSEYFLRNNQFFEESLVSLHLAALRASEKKPVEFRNAIRNWKLNRILKTASHLPFWKKQIGNKFIDTGNPLSALSYLPIITKSDLRSMPIEERTNKNISSTYGILTSTSGSTGEPLQFFIDGRLKIRQWALLSRVGDLQQFSRQSLIHIWPTQNPNPLFSGRFFSCKNIEELQWKMPIICDAISQPNVILHGLPSLLHLLLDFAEKDNLSLRPNVILTSGEELTHEMKLFFNERFHCKTVSYYGSRELSIMAGQCETGRFHENSEDIIFEVISEKGVSSRPGEVGRLVVTGLNSHIAPFIRYHLGDYGFFYDDPCPCGNHLPSFNFEGRTHDVGPILLSDGNHILPYKLTGIFNKRFEKIRQYQIIHDAPNSFVIYIVPTEICDRSDKLEMLADFKQITQNSRVYMKFVSSIKSNGSKVLPYIKNF